MSWMDDVYSAVIVSAVISALLVGMCVLAKGEETAAPHWTSVPSPRAGYECWQHLETTICLPTEKP